MYLRCFQKYLDEAGHVLEELIHEEALAKAAADADAAKAAAREAATESNSEFLRWKVFERAGVRAKLFVPLLMDWA